MKKITSDTLMILVVFGMFYNMGILGQNFKREKRSINALFR